MFFAQALLKGDTEGFVLFFVSHQFVLTIAHKLARVMQHIQFFCDFYVLTSNRGKKTWLVPEQFFHKNQKMPQLANNKGLDFW